ncbi:SDR family NAD(P)-dependent oxidoreductase [Chloroflexota bacterium]
MRFTDRVAIITGGARGIGKSVACGLAEEGGRVAIFDTREEEARETESEIKSLGGQVMALKIDVTQSKAVKDAVNTVLERFGKIDILVSNAGWSKTMPFTENTEEYWDKAIAVNLKAHLICCRAVIDDMVKRDYGKIVTIASDAGRAGLGQGNTVYAGCKAGVIAITKSLALELVHHKINVNCVSPGFTETPLLLPKGVTELPQELEQMRKGIPMRRLGQPDEIAAAILFMASDEASYITGQVISVNGGLCMPS